MGSSESSKVCLLQDEMVADVFTKPMEEGLFQKFTKLIFNESDTYEDYA